MQPFWLRALMCTLLGGVAAAAWPLAARAQQPDRMRRIGMLIPFPERDAEAQSEVMALRERLSQLGWTDGRNVRIDYRWSTGDLGRIATAAKELAALQPDVVFARTTPVTGALLRETRTIPKRSGRPFHFRTNRNLHSSGARSGDFCRHPPPSILRLPNRHDPKIDANSSSFQSGPRNSDLFGVEGWEAECCG
jgi:hypothetical protein